MTDTSFDAIGSANCLGPGAQIGEYRLLRVVGEGGFGVVYQARDLSLDRVVAIKEYMPSTLAGRMASNRLHVRPQHKGAFDAGLRSFINEARLLAKFSHPTLVHVYRFFEANGTAYMVMRYYEGVTLKSALLTQPGLVTETWLLRMLAPVLDVLEMLHNAGCYHRDISPDNIFLQSSGTPVLLDFGAARRIIGDLTQALTMVLKPGFAPIEQYVDDGAMPQGAWTDIYQIGAMLFLAVTGKQPATSVARMISDPMPTLTPANCHGFSAQFLRGIHHALAVKPNDRPQSIAALRVALGIAPSNAAIPVHSTPEVASSGSIQVIAGASTPTALANDLPPPRQSDASPSTATQNQAPVAARTTAPSPDALISSPDLNSNPFQEAIAPPKERLASKPKRSTEAATPAHRPDNKKKKSVWMTLGGSLLVIAIAFGLWQANVNEAKVVTPVDNEVRTVEVAASDSSPNQERQAHENAPRQAVDVGVDVVQLRESISRDPEPESVTASNSKGTPGRTSEDRSKPAQGYKSDKPPANEISNTPATTIQNPALARSKGDMGTVILRITPWGKVVVNRVAKGTTPPLKQLELPEGEHRIEIINPAAAPWIHTVRVRKGESVIVSHKFE